MKYKAEQQRSEQKKAKAADLDMLNKATENATPLTTLLAGLKAQGTILENIRTPVYIPQQELGSVRHFSGPNG